MIMSKTVKITQFKIAFKRKGIKTPKLPVKQTGVLNYGKEQISIRSIYSMEPYSDSFPAFELSSVQNTFKLDYRAVRLAKVQHAHACTDVFDVDNVKQVFVNQDLLILLAANAVFYSTGSIMANEIYRLGSGLGQELSKLIV